jgi:plasmid maintenance system antidote protein VapI
MLQRRGTAEQWSNANPILGSGEIGFETDTGQFKIGDQTTHWDDLPYFKNIEDLGGNLDDYILLTEKGVANGVATLNANTVIPDGQISNTIARIVDVQNAVSNAIADLTNNAPLILDTLAELANAINNEGDFYLNLANSINSSLDAANEYTDNNINTLANNVADEIDLLANLVANDIACAVSGLQGEISNAITTAEAYADNVAAVALGNAQSYTDGVEESLSQSIANAIIDLEDYADNAISTHNLETLNVHGISNTATLVTLTDLSNHESETSNVHGITNTLAIVFTDDSRLSDTRTPSDNSVTNAKMADNAIDTAEIANAAVTNAKLANNAVDTAQIANSAVTNAKLAGSIDQSKILGLSTTLGNLASLSGAAFTGNVSTTGSFTVDGDFTVNGSNVIVSATQIQIEDTLLQLGHTNSGNTTDLGLFASYNDGTQKHSGLVKDVSDSGKWKLFDGVTSEPGTTVNFAQGSLDNLVVNGLEATSITVGNVSNTEFGYLDGVTSNVQAQINNKAPLASPTFTGLVTLAANGIAFTDGTQILEGVPSRTPIIQKTASYTLSALTERDDLIEMNSVSETTLTIPLNSAVAFPVGTSIDILQTNTGQVTIAGDAGVTVNATPGLKLRTRWSSATLFKRAINTWVVYGDLTA